MTPGRLTDEQRERIEYAAGHLMSEPGRYGSDWSVELAWDEFEAIFAATDREQGRRGGATLTDAERKEFERIEDSGDTQGLTWRVERILAEHIDAALAEAERQIEDVTLNTTFEPPATAKGFWLANNRALDLIRELRAEGSESDDAE